MQRHLATNNDKQIYGFNRNPVYDLALDYNRKRLYGFKRWGTSNVIIEMDYDGHNRNHTTHYGPVFGCWSVDVVGNFLYWNDRSSPIIIKMNVSSRDISRYIPLPKGYTVRKLLVVDKNRQSEGKLIYMLVNVSVRLIRRQPKRPKEKLSISFSGYSFVYTQKNLGSV